MIPRVRLSCVNSVDLIGNIRVAADIDSCPAATNQFAGDDTLITVGANTLAGSAGNDSFVFFAGVANGATVADFDGLGAAQGDTLIFSGYGSAAQGATFTSLGNDQWQIHSGLAAHNETITLGNGASIHATDFLFV